MSLYPHGAMGGGTGSGLDEEFTMGHGMHEMTAATQVLGDPALAFGR